MARYLACSALTVALRSALALHVDSRQLPEFGFGHKSADPEIKGAPARNLVRWSKSLMDKYPNKPDVAKSACEVFAMRGYAESDKGWMLDGGFLNMSVGALKRFPNDKSVQLACAKAVGGMSLFNQKNMQVAGELGAVELVVNIMQRWRDDPQAQIGGVSGCFMDLSYENRARWAQAGGIAVNIDSARKFYKQPDTVVEATYAFSSGTQPPNEQRFVDAGGVQLLMDLMQDHGRSKRVREECMQATRPLARHSAGLRAKLVEAGYVPLLVTAMEEATLDKHQLSVACDNLKLLVSNNATLVDTVVNAGATLKAFDAVRLAYRMGDDGTHPAYTEATYTVQEDCLELLTLLSPNEQARQELIRAGAPFLMFRLVQDQPQNQRLQEGAAALSRSFG